MIAKLIVTAMAILGVYVAGPAMFPALRHIAFTDPLVHVQWSYVFLMTFVVAVLALRLTPAK
jgi:hypothetical protein